MKLVKLTGTTKAVVLRSLAREGLAAYSGQLVEMDLFRISKLGKL